MNKKILFILKRELGERPPVLGQLRALSSLGIQVSIICNSCMQGARLLLEGEGIKVEVLYPAPVQPAGIMGKLAHWRQFRSRVLAYLAKNPNPGILWVASGDTALALGKRLLAYSYVLQLFELNDTAPMYRNGLREYARRAKLVVCPEMSRAGIFRSWWDLEKTPVVIPNKPFGINLSRNMPISSPVIARQIADLGNVPILLYQGQISECRRLEVVAHAIQMLDQPIRLVLMGKDHGEFVHALRLICPNLLYLGFVSPPAHLEITSHAAVGILQYDYSCLNNVFCAPNKVWEYAGCDVPALAPDLPALRYYYDRYNAGLCCSFSNPGVIADSLSLLLEKPCYYAEGAKSLYNSVSLEALLKALSQELWPN